MDFDYLRSVIEDLKAVHKSLVKRIDFSHENKTLAIYLLQGGLITSLCSALAFNQEGRAIPEAQQKRLIDEGMDLVWFFDEISDDARQIKAWFQENIVEREPGNKGNLTDDERANRSGLTLDEVKLLEKLKKKRNHEISKYAHPSILAMRANMDKKTHVFDYEHQDTKSMAIGAEDFAAIFVLPIINSMLISKNNVQLLAEEQAQIINNHRTKINNLLDKLSTM